MAKMSKRTVLRRAPSARPVPTIVVKTPSVRPTQVGTCHVRFHVFGDWTVTIAVQASSDCCFLCGAHHTLQVRLNANRVKNFTNRVMIFSSVLDGISKDSFTSAQDTYARGRLVSTLILLDGAV